MSAQLDEEIDGRHDGGVEDLAMQQVENDSGVVPEATTDAAATEQHEVVHQADPDSTISDSLAPITVRIDFALATPRLGFHFVLSDPVRFPFRWNHAHSSDIRSVFPCIDNLKDKCTWDFEFVVPQRLARFNGEKTNQYTSVADAFLASKFLNALQSLHAGVESEYRDIVVVCSGDLVEEVAHPSDSDKKIVLYRLEIPALTRSIAFAIGPFEAYRIDNWPPSTEAGNGGAIFALPGRGDDAVNTCSFLGEVSSFALHHVGVNPPESYSIHFPFSRCQQALSFYVNEYLTSTYPFSSFKVVAVENVHVPIKVAATMVTIGTHLLVPEDAVEQTYETRQLLAKALAQQWFVHYITPRA